MGYAAAAEALMRRKHLEEMYERMTDEEKRTFVLMTMQNKSANDIMQAIQQRSTSGRLLPTGRKNQQHLEHLVEHADRDRWYTAFGSDVAANVLTTSAFWLFGKLFSK